MFNSTILFILLFNISTIALAKTADCKFNYTPNNSKLIWTAFKTPKKVGVNVEFKKFTISSTTQNTIEDVIKNATFNVDTESLDSGNPDRDKKIKKHFFRTDKRRVRISGIVKEVNQGVAQVEFTINNKTKLVPMKIELGDKQATLTGSIDVLDFALNKSLDAIHKACKVLHEGKTWADVDLKFIANFESTCN